MEASGGSASAIVQIKRRGSKDVCAAQLPRKSFKKSLASFAGQIKLALPNENWAHRRVWAINKFVCIAAPADNFFCFVSPFCPAAVLTGNHSRHLVFDGGGQKREKKAAMHLKKWFLGLCLIVLVVGEIFLFSANRQKSDALAQARTAKQAAEQLHADLDQLKTADAAQALENTRLRSENQSLSKRLVQLQNDNGRLQKSNQQLTQQLDATSASAQQQQEQLQQIRAAAEQTQAEDERNACINNLRQIDAAKQQWALENNKTADSVPAAQDLLPYFKDQAFPACPSGGIYTIGAVGVPPTCSIPGHVLPQPQAQ